MEHGAEREAPLWDLIQLILLISFIGIWFLDTFILRFSIFLNIYFPLFIRIPIGSILLGLTIILGYLSHGKIFVDHKPSKDLITDGIFNYVRNPMYLAVLVFFLSLIVFSISLLSFGVFIINFFIYNYAVNYEEKVLEEIYGEEYKYYKQKVPKWLPGIKK